ncbi:MAG: caspase family protein, partial [Alphaproteobacteria bacterium]
DENHNKLFEWRSRAVDFRDMGSDFKLSADGSQVYFRFATGSDATALFALEARALILDPPPPGEDFTPPMLNTPAMRVANWQGSYAPTLNGAALLLQPYERAESYAVAPGGSGILLGTRWRVIRYGANANLIWSFQAPGETWALNITPDGRLAVAAFGDGSIRWYRMRDAVELLALFPHKDGARWVAWTPAGHYLASPGGDSLVGWHVNRGPDKAADFFAVGRFRDVYYRPDIVTEALGLEAQGTRADIGQLLPPVVASLALAGGAEISAPRVTLALSVRAAAGDTLRAIQVRADGRPIAALEGDLADLADGTPFEMPLTVPRHDSEITVVAEGTRGTVSEAARLSLRWTGGAADKRPNLYLLAVGVSRYAAEELRLNFAHQDARDFADMLLEQDGRAYGAVHVRILSDDEASGAALRDGLAWLTREARAGDFAALFLAGHGVDDASGRYFFLPHDGDPARLAETALAYTEIKQALTSLSARSLLFVDTCRAGAVWGRPGEPSTDVVRVVNDLSSPENGVIVFASSTHAQLSVENADWENGAFTEAILEGLAGRADLFGDGEVTVSTLDAYISHRVKKLTAGRQTPAVGKPVEADFPLALISADAGE